jgi:hypothetical protein
MGWLLLDSLNRLPPWHADVGAGAVHPINACRRDELLNGETFYTLREAQIIGLLVERLRRPRWRLLVCVKP